MGRLKTFDEEAVLQNIMRVFWQHGYVGTTFSRLEADTGLTGRSLINAFGEKDDLFLKSLEHYCAETRVWLTPLADDPTIANIIAFFRDIANALSSDPRNFGCLMVNTVFEGAKINPAAKNCQASFRNMVRERFLTALVAAKLPGAEAKADLLCTTLWGMGAEIRSSGTVKSVASTVDEVIALLENWQASSPAPA
ncbi:MAG: TetR/AcrR family transcriptional regulator [Thalassospira sp.]|uniref:TetR/AcrR family transcriptional regulator n=1 Tax=Thalassospira sp. TaxID=1912094 RepID=UPI0032EC2351